MGGGISSIINQAGMIPFISLRYFKNIKISPVPVLSSEEAIDIARKDFVSDKLTEFSKRCSLYVYPLISKKSLNDFTLAYKITLTSLSPPKSYVYFIDAFTGKILEKIPNLITNFYIEGKVYYGYHPEHNWDPPLSYGKMPNVHGKVSTPPGNVLDEGYTNEQGYYYLEWEDSYYQLLLNGTRPQDFINDAVEILNSEIAQHSYWFNPFTTTFHSWIFCTD